MIKKIFTLTWWLGFIITVALMVWLYTHIETVGYLKNFNEKFKNLFLFLGIGHMALLVILGFLSILKSEDDNVEVASRVSTMGYLHTLIGTSVALIQMASIQGGIAGELQTILIPIGSALLTSIIGWAFAKEMERDRYLYKSSKREEVEDSLDFLAKKIRTVGINLEATSVSWEKSIDHTINKLIASADRLENNVARVEDGFEKSIKRAEDEFIKNVKILENGLTEHVKTVEDGFKIVGSKFSKNTEMLDVALANNMKTIEKGFTENVEILNSGLSQTTTTIEKTFMNNVKTLNSGLSENIKIVENGFKKNMSAVEKALTKSTQTSEEFLKNLHLSFVKTFRLMENVSVEWTKHLHDLEKFSKESDGSLEELFKNSRKIAKEVTLVAETLPSATNIIKEVDALIALLRERDERTL